MALQEPTLRAVIIDDEQHCIQSLRNDLTTYCPEVTIAAEATGAKEGLLAIREHQPNLVFLDVAMPWMNGFEMLELLPEITFSLIFTTAHDEYAAKAFRRSAVDYLLKPVDPTELKDAVAKAAMQVKQSPAPARVANLLQNFHQPEPKQKIAFPYREGFEFIEPDHILYCEAEGAYTRIHLHDKRVLLVSRSLGDIAELLPMSEFLRIHHSSIVHVKSITHFIRSDGGYVQLQNGVKLMVSKSKKDAVLERLGLK